jgi:hypothetical protein
MSKTVYSLLIASILFAVGCSRAEPAATAEPALATRVIDVYKSPTCSCCHEWEAYLRARGYTVNPIPTQDVSSIKQRYRLPAATWSCHTALIGGYFVEGHVPLEAIEDLLEQRPAIDGIALPAMPAGSPGMPGLKAAAFEILAITDGAVSDFGAY